MLAKIVMRYVMVSMGGVFLAGALGESLTFGTYPDTETWPAPTSVGRVAFVGLKIALAALGLWMIYRGLRRKPR